jgi:hypothetical protein
MRTNIRSFGAASARIQRGDCVKHWRNLCRDSFNKKGISLITNIETILKCFKSLDEARTFEKGKFELEKWKQEPT